MERTLSLRNACGLIVGIVMGSGIFASPGFVLGYVGSAGASLVVWAVCGLLTVAGALSMAELSAAMPVSGGENVYLSRAFNPMVGFAYTWITGTLAKPAGAAAIATVFGDYVTRLGRDSLAPEVGRKAAAVGAITFLAMIQLISTRVATSLQDTFTMVKLVMILFLCTMGMGAAADPGSVAARNASRQLSPKLAFVGTTTDIGDWAQALTNCLFSCASLFVLCRALPLGDLTRIWPGILIWTRNRVTDSAAAAALQIMGGTTSTWRLENLSTRHERYQPQ